MQKCKKWAGRKRVRTEGGISWNREESGAVGREPRVSCCASHLTGRDFPGGSVVQNPPSASGDAGSILSQGAKIPHARKLPSLRATPGEKPQQRAHLPQP